MEFKDILKQLRQRRGYSQVQLADMLGVSSGLIGMYEIGKRKPSYEQLEAVADLFNVSIDYLMGKESGSTYYLAPAAAEIASSLSDSEISFLKKFRSLNTDGQSYIIDQLDYALSKEKYIKKGSISEFESA